MCVPGLVFTEILHFIYNGKKKKTTLRGPDGSRTTVRAHPGELQLRSLFGVSTISNDAVTAL